MRHRTLAASALCLLLAACVHQQVVVLLPGPAWIDPSSAVQLAAAAPRDGVTDVFAMTLRGRMRRARRLSEFRTRVPRPAQPDGGAVAGAGRATARQAGRPARPLEQRLHGHALQVGGSARRTRIMFFAAGQATDRCCCQTQVQVTKVGQIRPL